MIVTIHQPNFLPWLGYFDKMARANLFVYLDNVPFSKNNYQNRTRIKTVRGPGWLSVPVQTSGRFGQLTADVPIDNRGPWARKHLARLADAYGRTPGWAEVRAFLEPIMVERAWDLLAPMNIALIEALRGVLDVTTPTVLASQLDATGHSTELLIGICRAVGADIYLAGSGSAAYLEEERFAEAGIAVTHQQFDHPVYAQPHGAFEPGLSAVDAICALGSAAASALLNGHRAVV
jgi:hypothetical protein